MGLDGAPHRQGRARRKTFDISERHGRIERHRLRLEGTPHYHFERENQPNRRDLAQGQQDDSCSFDGKPFDGSNDLVVDKKDGVYFTLSNSGTVLYALPGAKVIKVFADPVERINGITLSRDEKTLYVATQSRVAKTTLSIADLPKEGGEYILAFDVQPDGTVKNRRNFAKYEIVTQRPNGTPDVRFGGDGLAIDGQDRVYAATAAGIQVFSPQGKHLGTIPVSRNPNNLAFAGPDKKTLYIVARGAVYQVAMLAEGYKGRAK